MPTVHVTPDGVETLQTIANTVWKARKVVVVTGAGISTNSGIPDFRSEHGLYSLIQAQYEDARNHGPSSSDPLQNISQDEPATKRRKLSCSPSDALSLSQTTPVDTPAPDEPPPLPTIEADPACQIPPPRDAATAPASPMVNNFSSPLSSPPRNLFDPSDGNSSTTSEVADHDGGITPPNSQSTSNNRQVLPNMKGKDLFDVSVWSDPVRTSVFYTFTTNLRRKVKESKPTPTHHFISHIRDRGKLVRCYTQNIDEIEEKVGLSTSLCLGPGHKGRFARPNRASAPAALNRSVSDPGVLESKTTTRSSGVECVFLHGSLSALRCFVCGLTSEWESDREMQTLSGEQPVCPHCVGATAAREGRGKRALGVGKLRPDIVLYGEDNPNAHLIDPVVRHDLALSPDIILVLGTSLRVHGLKVLVREFARSVHAKGGTVIFVNLTGPSQAWGDVIDYWVEWDCDAWVDDLKSRENFRESKEKVRKPSLKPIPSDKAAGETNKAPPPKRKKPASPDEQVENAPKRVPALRCPNLPELPDDPASLFQRLFAVLAKIDEVPHTFSQSIHRPLDPSAFPDWPQRNVLPFTTVSTMAPVPVDGTQQAVPAEDTIMAESPLTADTSMTASPPTGDKAIESAELDASVPTVQEDQPLEHTTAEKEAPTASQELEQVPIPTALPVETKSQEKPAAKRGRGRPRKSNQAPALEKPQAKTVEKTVKPEQKSRASPEETNPPPQALMTIQQTPLPHTPSLSDGVAAAIKSNPRKRKAKMIDGQEVVLPVAGKSRSSPPLRASATPAPAGNDQQQQQPPVPPPAPSQTTLSTPANRQSKRARPVLPKPPKQSPVPIPTIAGMPPQPQPQLPTRNPFRSTRSTSRQPDGSFTPSRLAPCRVSLAEGGVPDVNANTSLNPKISRNKPIISKESRTSRSPVAPPFTQGDPPPHWLTESLQQTSPPMPTYYPQHAGEQNAFQLSQPLLRLIPSPTPETPRSLLPAPATPGPPLGGLAPGSQAGIRDVIVASTPSAAARTERETEVASILMDLRS